MRRKIIHRMVLAALLLVTTSAFAWEGMKMPPLHVDGNQLKDPGGNTVILHGYAQTFSPWFNERGKHWNHYDVEGCLRYKKRDYRPHYGCRVENELRENAYGPLLV